MKTNQFLDNLKRIEVFKNFMTNDSTVNIGKVHVPALLDPAANDGDIFKLNSIKSRNGMDIEIDSA
jgi:hypothetical protein